MGASFLTVKEVRNKAEGQNEPCGAGLDGELLV